HVGGLEKSTEELHQLFVNYGHRVTIFTSAIPSPTTASLSTSNLSVIHYPAFDIIFGYPVPKFWTITFWRDWHSLFNTPYDIVLSSTRFFLSSLLALIFARMKQLPHLHIEHGSDYVQTDNKIVSLLARLYDETIGRFVLRHSTCNISPSRSAQHFVYRFDSRPSPIVYRGVNASLIDNIPSSTPFSLKAEQLLLVFAGRLIDAKGIPDLIQACSRLPRSRYRLAIIGAGPMQPLLTSQVSRLNLTSNIHFLGQLSHHKTISILKSADVCINPSYNEGLPTILLEAGLAGCALVASNVGGTSEIISHQYSGLLYQPGDNKALNACLSLLLEKPLLRQHLASTAKNSIIRRFNWSTTYSHYLNLFHQYITHDPAKT
ncbi:MAG: hypothetical protein A3G57_02800, partial [Candidatus Andersenbacteria bacterium RIFCSPLOWO2_12_FULL_45_8]